MWAKSLRFQKTKIQLPTLNRACLRTHHGTGGNKNKHKRPSRARGCAHRGVAVAAVVVLCNNMRILDAEISINCLGAQQ